MQSGSELDPTLKALAAARERTEHLGRQLHNGSRREARARRSLQDARQQNTNLKKELAHLQQTRASETTAASEQAAKLTSAEAALTSMSAHYRDSLQAMSAAAHHDVIEERRQTWERSNAVVRMADARVEAANAERDRFREIAAQAQSDALASRRWAEHAVADMHARSWEFAERVGEKLRATEELLKTRQAELLDTAQEMAEAEIEERVEAAVLELEGQMDAALDEVEHSLGHAQDRLKLHERYAGEMEQYAGARERETQELQDQVSELVRQNRILRKRVERRDAHQRGCARAAQKRCQPAAFRLKGRGGVIPMSVRNLVRELILLGLKVDQVSGAIHTVGDALGVPIEGSISKRSIGRCMTELLVAGKMQIAENVHLSDSECLWYICKWRHTVLTSSRTAIDLSVSGDGTGIRHVEHISRNIYLNHHEDHTRMLIGVHSAPNHTSDGQLQGWNKLTADYFQTYNSSPRGKEAPADPRELVVKSTGAMADHAEDQKRLARLWEEQKKVVDREVRGEKALATMAQEELLTVITEETLKAIEVAGGNHAWAILDAQALNAQSAAIMHAAVMRVGEAEYQALSDEAKVEADLFVRGGCCMHKDLNAVKGVNTRLQAFWSRTGHTPILLMNRDNDTASTSTDPRTRQRAAEKSCGGAIKLVELAGAIFRHKDDKKGQQDSWRYFSETRLGYPITFPNTSSTRFGSYVEAAAELITHRDLYLEYLEIVRDKKDSRSFNHMEHNVYLGLQDLPTLTELCVLALYGQVISRPYMRQVRRGDTNHWDLGPLHDRVKTLLRMLIENPDLILYPDLSSTDGALDRRPCDRPEVFAAVQKLVPTLPWLRDALVEGFSGGLETWERFTTEFASGTHPLSAVARQKAWMKPTNDDNEGALGVRRVRKRACPSMSEHQHNARDMGKVNNTLDYMKNKLTAADLAFTLSEGRRLDASKLEHARHEEIVQADEEQVAGKRQKDAEKANALTEKLRELLKLEPFLDPDDPRLNDKLTVKQIDAHLDWHREFYDTGPKDEKKIPMKSALKLKDEKLKALVDAATRFKAHPLSKLPELTDGMGSTCVVGHIAVPRDGELEAEAHRLLEMDVDGPDVRMYPIDDAPDSDMEYDWS